MNNEITLIGGGLVGSLLALMLAKNGNRVKLFESRQDLRRNNISAGRSINLALANRGIKPLSALGLMDDIEKLIIPMRGRMVHLEDGSQQLQPYGSKDTDIIYSISRGDLNKLLLNKAEETGLVETHFEQPLTKVDLSKKTITLANSEKTFSFDKLIGADGANSIVRSEVVKQTKTEESIEPLAHSYKELCIPGQNGDFQIDENALHIWPRGKFMLIALPNLDGSFTVTLFMPNTGETSFESISDETSLLAFFRAYFPDVIPLIPNLVEDFFTNPTGKLATVRCESWFYKDSALILGDAAHAIVPFHGQGMNCGFEDCYDFIEILNQKDDWETCFSAFESARKANANAIADMALENYIEMRDSVRQPEYLLKKQFAFKLNEWFPERFIPRYAMVMFSEIPYAEAQRLGRVHDELLDQLANQFSTPDNLDKSKVDFILKSYGL